MKQLVLVENIDDISKGDLVVLTGGGLTNKPFEVDMVKVSEDGTEIILDKKSNKFFNLGMYLEGRSWVKELAVMK